MHTYIHTYIPLACDLTIPSPALDKLTIPQLVNKQTETGLLHFPMRRSCDVPAGSNFNYVSE